MKTIQTIRNTGLAALSVLLMNSTGKCATFTAVASGNWSSTTTWGGSAPSFTDNGDDVIIPSGITVTMDNSVTLSGTLSIVEVEGTLTGASTTALTITSGTVSGAGTITAGSVDFGSGALVSFTGTITANTYTSEALTLETSANIVVNNSITITSGVLTILTGGTLTMGSNASLIIAGGSLATNGGSLVLSSTYNVEYTASTVTTGLELSGSGLNNVTINVPSSSSVVLGSDLTVAGTLALTNGALMLGGHNLTITGDVSSTETGTVSSTSASNIVINTSTSLSGAIPFSGTSNAVNNLSVTVGSGNHAGIKGMLAVAGVLTLQSGSLNLMDTSTLTINGDVAATGSGTIAASPTSNLTINTNSAPSGSISFASGSSTLTNLTINVMNGGSASIGSDLTVSGTLNLTKGNLNIGNNMLQIGSSGSITGAGSSSYVITGASGHLSMSLTAGASGSTTFPVGTAAYYFPASVMLNSGSSSGMVMVNVTPNVYAHGSGGTVVSASQGVVDATWDISSSVSSNLNLSMMLMWSSTAEVNGFDRTHAYISHYTNNAWDVTATANATAEGNGMYAMSRNNLTSLSPFAVFDQGTNAGITIPDVVVGAFNLYPNPAKDKIYITNSEPAGAVTYADIIDLTGQVLGTYTISGNNTSISLGALNPGCYFIRLYNDKSSAMQKFVKM